jgi:hypothetical protein
VALSVAEVRRLVQLQYADEKQRAHHLHWSRFRRRHQAGARRCHLVRRAAQLPLRRGPIPEPVPILGLPDLTEERWERLFAVLPPQKPRTGRPAEDHRRIVSGIFFVIRTGCSWRQLPQRFGSWQTVADRYRRWVQEGRWAQILQVFLQEVPFSSSA